VATVQGRGSSTGGPRDHDHVDMLPQHPGRAIWAHEGLAEFQGIILDNAGSLRLLEERRLREDDASDSEGGTGVSRWRPAPPPSPADRRPASMRHVELGATARLGTVGELLVATGAGLRSIVPRPPTPVVQGYSLRRTRVTAPSCSTPWSLTTALPPATSPPATPLPTTPDARPALRVEAWHHADLCDEEELLTVVGGADRLAHHHDDDDLVAVAAVDDPFVEQTPNDVTLGRSQACGHVVVVTGGWGRGGRGLTGWGRCG
jgi:hypothetical protein